MEEKQSMVMDVHERPKLAKWLLLSLQHLFAMFGATITVPYLVPGIEPSTALLTSGLGTLAYLLITRGQIPAYLGSSFAFIAPLTTVITADGVGSAMFASFIAGIVYGIVALAIRQFGVGWLHKLLPPVVVGPVIMVIGLGLAATAVDMAMNDTDGAYDLTLFTVALVTLISTIIAALLFRGFFGLIPILIGIVVGYVYSAAIGIINFTDVREAAWIGLPEALYIPFITYDPVISWMAVAIIVPIAFVTMAEHVGDQMVLSKVMERDLLRKPGLHRSLFGDGVATIISSLLGGPPNTTYGENIGVLTITRIFSVVVVGGAAVLAVGFAFVPKVSALIHSIPANVMGGVSILLFGFISLQGMRMLIESGVQIQHKRNLIVASAILIIGIGGAMIQFGDGFELSGMALAAIVGIILNVLLPNKEVARGNKEMFDGEQSSHSQS